MQLLGSGSIRRMKILRKGYPMRSLVICAALAIIFPLSGYLQGPVSSKAFANDLVVEIWASTNCVDPGGAVALRASITNRGLQIHAVELQDRPVLDLCIESYGGYKKCWSDGKPLTPDLTRLELKPGESKTIEMKWVAEPSGVYGAGATFAYDPNTTTGPNVTVGVEGDCPGQGMR